MSLPTYLHRNLMLESNRWQLWLCVPMGVGIGIYFSLYNEPWEFIGIVCLISALLIYYAFRTIPLMRLISLIGIMMAFGFTAAQFKTYQVAAPIIQKRVGSVDLIGRVDSVEPMEKGGKLVLSHLETHDPSLPPMPEKIRIRMMQTPEIWPSPGNFVRLKTMLSPPMAPSVPGGYDFARHLYFQSIGGSGFTNTPIQILDVPEDSTGLFIKGIRQDIIDKIRSHLTGPVGEITIALLTGERSAIPGTVMSDIRASGLAHLLAISGLHVGLIAGLIFGGIRAFFALWPKISLNFPIKKIAAVFGLVSAISYMFLVGASVSTQRAVFMTSLIFIAILINRTALTMRSVALAAILVMALFPEGLLGPSFQMSFGAVVALIAFYETYQNRYGKTISGKIWYYLVGIFLTSLIASLATAPYALFHFQKWVNYGILANMVAVPITALWVMPWGIISYLAMPLGLEHWPLQMMGYGVWVIIETAHMVATLPHALYILPAMPDWGIILMTFSGLWLCFWQQRWRYYGLVGIALGLTSIFLNPKPDLLISPDAKLLGYYTQSGDLMVSSIKRAKFHQENWSNRLAADSILPLNWDCKDTTCITTVKDTRIAFLNPKEEDIEGCPDNIDLVLSLRPVRHCNAAHVIDFFKVWRHGAHAIYLDPFKVITDHQVRGHRPWTPQKWRE